MSTQKPLYGIGQHVMLRFPRRCEFNCDHTVIMNMEWVRQGCELWGSVEHGLWEYEVSKNPGWFILEEHIRPRPDPGIGWDRLKQLLKQPQPEHCE